MFFYCSQQSEYFKCSYIQSFLQSSRPKPIDPEVIYSYSQVKTIGICVFNSMWVSKCFGKPALPPLKVTVQVFVGRVKFLTIFCAGESGGVLRQHAGQLHRDSQLPAHHAAVHGHREVLAEGHRERPGISELPLLQRTLQHGARKRDALPPGHRRGEYHRSHERIQVDVLEGILVPLLPIHPHHSIADT